MGGGAIQPTCTCASVVAAMAGGPTPPPDGSGLATVAAQMESVVARLAGVVDALGGTSGRAPAAAGVAAPPPAGAPAGARAGAAAVRVASFNALGESHTAPGGDKARGWRSGVQRVPDMVAGLRRHDIEIAGLQEFQLPQQEAFRAANTGYAMHGERDNVVVWRTDRYRKVDARSLTIPYFGGAPREMPVVQLEDRRSGRRVWVVNVHNPASTRRHPGNESNRVEAMRRERVLVAELEATGVPVLLVGDFNERGQARTTMTAGGAMTASDPRAGVEHIDWIFGTRDMRFTNGAFDGSMIDRRISDHPMVVATAHL